MLSKQTLLISSIFYNGSSNSFEISLNALLLILKKLNYNRYLIFYFNILCLEVL